MVLDTYFSNNKYFISKHHLDSYNQFINSTIDTVIQSMNPFTIIKKNEQGRLKHNIDVTIGSPTFVDTLKLLPNECRIQNKSYVYAMHADVTISITENMGTKLQVHKPKVLKDVFMCHIPVMLHSQMCKLYGAADIRKTGECQFDQGGYFVIDGKEKVIVAQERNVNNRLFVSSARDDTYAFQAFMRCTSETDSVFPKTLWLYITHKGQVHVKVPHISVVVSLFVLFRALGMESDLAIIKLIVHDYETANGRKLLDYLRPSVIEGSILFGQTEALAFIQPHTDFKTIENVLHVFFEDFFPNVPSSLSDKAKILGETVRHLIEVGSGLRQESDRDNYIAKRVGISGFLLGDIFKDFYNNFRVETMKKIDNKYEFGANLDNIMNLINEHNKAEIFGASEKFQFGLVKSLKGNWGLLNDSTKQGIVQDLNRISYMGFISHLRRVNAPMDTSIKIRSPHQLETSQYGMMCPCESPDGASIGLLKNMAVLCNISFSVSFKIMLAAIEKYFEIVKLIDVEYDMMSNLDATKLCINNNWLGIVYKPAEIVEYIRMLRRGGFINVLISVSWNIPERRINVLTEAGRCCRPLYIVKDGSLVYKASRDGSKTWRELLIGDSGLDNEYHESFIDPGLRDAKSTGGVIEFLDVEETNCSLIAMTEAEITPETTHCEIHPSTIFSVYSSTIPFSNHNQAPRNIFSGAQGKQAIGVYSTSFNNRIDTMSYLLHYPQRPIVTTKYMDYLNANSLPNGENLIVAISTCFGYNQEDSIAINAASVQRGMFNLTYFKSYISEEIRDEKKGIEVLFANPNVLKVTRDVKLTKFADYSKLDENGMPLLESYMDEGDCIIGKCLKKTDIKLLGNPEKDIYVAQEESVSYESKCEIVDKTTVGFVDKLVMFENENKEKIAKIRMRKVRSPELGDKMACYSADTEVLTSRGWIGWDELTINDLVASLTPEFALTYVKPSQLYHYDFDGNMRYFTSDHMDFLVTPNHNMFVGYPKTNHFDYIRADEIGDLTTSSTTPPAYMLAKSSYASSFNNIEVTKDLVLVGLLHRYGVQNTKTDEIFFDVQHVNKLKRFHIRFTENESDSGSVGVVNEKYVKIWPSEFAKREIYYAMMVALYDSPCNRRLPEFVWTLSPRCCKTLLYTILDDQTIVHNSECSIIDIQQLALHALHSATYRGSNVTLDYENFPLIEAKNTTVPYSGRVYCCEVPQGVVYVRRHGKAAFCGNSRHGQKGVVGAIFPPEMMPFTKDGLVPDIVINPHAFPTRMTIGHLIECILAKSGAAGGFYADGTAFEDQDWKDMSSALEAHGLDKNADEIMYNGVTGDQMACEIFIGPTYYYRMKHMVADKINSRETGQMVGMTHQPTKGRSNGGGLRVGEMETNVLISHGLSAFTKESMMERSDKYQVCVSKATGMIIPVNAAQKIVPEPYSTIKMPYAAKQLIYELETMSIGTRLDVLPEDDFDDEDFEDSDSDEKGKDVVVGEMPIFMGDDE